MLIKPGHHYKLQGWETLFQELDSFLRDSDRHLGNATVNYLHYAVDKPEVIVQKVIPSQGAHSS